MYLCCLYGSLKVSEKVPRIRCKVSTKVLQRSSGVVILACSLSHPRRNVNDPLIANPDRSSQN